MSTLQLKDLVLERMPSLVSVHNFVVHPLGFDEVLMTNGRCALLVFRDREGINVSVVLDGVSEYPMGVYLVTKRSATSAVAAAGPYGSGAHADKVDAELAWYDCALSLCARDVLNGSVEWISDYPAKPTTLALPTRSKVGEILHRHPQRPQ